MANAGATLIVHGRNGEKGKVTVEEIISETGNKAVSYYNADFASLEEVAQFSKEIKNNYKHLHILINNAAVGGGPKDRQQRQLSKDGFELRLAVNFLAHFLLTQNLLPLLLHSMPSRIVMISSIGQSPLDFDDLMMEKHYDSFEAYCRSKLAQIIYGFELADQLKGQNITVNSLHPASLMNTNMVHQYFGYTTSSVEDGANVVEYVATAEETENITGAYFNQMKQARAKSQAYDPEARKKLWQVSEKLIIPYRI